MAAIYQRARPTRFDEVVGQDHVKDVLAAAVRRGAVGHAYLFSGPRGVGKTTTARLLAMAVNCEVDDGEQRPCGRCASCRLVQEGAHPDVAELDAASNNSVDDVRELREKVRLSPMRGRTRVWVLDEAHMLSRAAANALLKTLEEPPPGLLFVLATTEPEKLPPTVLSRCQHFRFRRLSDAEIRGKLERLLHAAEVEADPEALALVARSADGAMRDAESLLERLLAVGGPVTREAAEDALGLPPHERLVELAQALAHDDLEALLGGAALLYRDGFAPRTIAERLARTLRDALVAVVRGVGDPQLEVDAPALVRALHALDDAEDRFTRNGDLYALEITLIRAHAALAGTVTGPAPLGLAAGAAAEVTAAAPVEPAPATTEHVPPTTEPTSRRPAPTPADVPEGAKPPGARGRPVKGLSWHQVLTLAGPQLRAFLHPADAVIADDVVHLRYDERHTFHFNQLARREAELYALVDGAGGAAYGVVIEGPGGRFRRPKVGGDASVAAPAPASPATTAKKA